MTEEKMNDRLKRLLQCLVARLKSRRTLIFGLRARGNARPGSDIDLAVEGAAPMPFREERKLKERLYELAGLCSVDLLFLERACGDFRRLVEQTGKVPKKKRPKSCWHLNAYGRRTRDWKRPSTAPGTIWIGTA